MKERWTALTGRLSADSWGLLLVAAFTLWHLSPLLTPPFASQAIVGADTYRSHDWLEVAKLDLYARRALLEWGSLPLWNPLVAGGQPQLPHPSDGSASPLILTSLLFGEILGMKLNILWVALMGALGIFLLMRRVLAVSVFAAVAAACAYVASGWLPSRVAVGFYESCLMAAWPLVLALWLMPGERRMRRRRWALAAVLVWTLSIQLQLAVPVLVLWMLVLWLTMSAGRWMRGLSPDWETLLGGLLLLATGALLGAVKFLPMLHMLSEQGFRVPLDAYPLHPDAWYIRFDQLWYALFHHVPNLPLLDRDGNPRVQEYMTLQPGLAALLLAGLGGAIVLRRGGRGAPFLAAGGIFLWLSFGPHAPIDGFRLLHPLPLFESMRGPLRYLNFPVLVSLILLAGLGFDALFAGRRFQTQAWGLGAALVLGLPTAIDTQSLYETAFLYRPPQVEATESPQSEGLRSRSLGGADHINLRKYVNTQRGTPTIYVPEDVPVEVAARPVGWLTIDGGLAPEPQYRGEAWVVEPDGNPQAAGKPPGTAELVAYRAQEIEVAVHLEREGLVLLNQNAWPGWECDDLPASQVAARSQGLVGFVAPSGPKRTVLCRWTAPWWRQGLIGSLSGLLVLGLLWPWPKGKKASGAL